MWNGGVLSTGGGLIFQGTADGVFEARDASGGALLWSFDAKLGIVAAPMTYRVGRRQFVSVLVGYGGGDEFVEQHFQSWLEIQCATPPLADLRARRRRRTSATAPRDFAVHAVDDPDSW